MQCNALATQTATNAYNGTDVAHGSNQRVRKGQVIDGQAARISVLRRGQQQVVSVRAERIGRWRVYADGYRSWHGHFGRFCRIRTDRASGYLDGGNSDVDCRSNRAAECSWARLISPRPPPIYLLGRP